MEYINVLKEINDAPVQLIKQHSNSHNSKFFLLQSSIQSLQFELILFSFYVQSLTLNSFRLIAEGCNIIKPSKSLILKTSLNYSLSRKIIVQSVKEQRPNFKLHAIPQLK